MRNLFIFCLLFLTSGCAVWNYFVPCDDCALATDESFQSTDEMGVLAIGLTVIPTSTVAAPDSDAGVSSDDEIAGNIGWLVTYEQAQDSEPVQGQSKAKQPGNQDLMDLRFPPGLTAGQHRLVLWRVPPGRWALRNGRIGDGSNSILTQVLKPWGAITHVSAGHITYAGELSITANPQGKIRSYVLDVGYDPQFAHRALEEFTQISAPMEDVPFTEVHREKLRGH